LIFNVGTRKSALALKQTDMVLLEAVQAFPKYSFAVKAKDTAAGDIDKVTPFKDMPVKNIWTHELETLMIEKELDFLVHALKGVVEKRAGKSGLANYCQMYRHNYRRTVKSVRHYREKILEMPWSSRLVDRPATSKICLLAQ